MNFYERKNNCFSKYLTCNTLISNKYNAGLNLTNRDDLRNFCNLASKSIENLKKDYSKKFSRSNKRFLSDFVYGNTKSVPDNITKAVLSSIKNLENRVNIYLHLEVLNRELDSKLLLAVIAASRGHEVIVSDQEFNKRINKKISLPGIFHTKSLTPGKLKILKHQQIINTDVK